MEKKEALSVFTFAAHTNRSCDMKQNRAHLYDQQTLIAEPV